MTEKEILAVEKRIGYTFRDRSLLVQAFTRPSYVNEKGRTALASNQVLEFFGDSVLSCVLITLLSRDFTERYAYGVKTKFTEGDFSVMKSHLSDKTNLSKTTASLGFGPYLLMSEGDKKEGVEKQPSVLEDLYESIIGAIWLDSGNDIEAVTRVVENTLDFRAFAMDLVKPNQSAKNRLQEFCQDKKRRLPTPIYRTVGRQGEDHNPTYLVECRVGEYAVTGEGKNTQKAQTASAEAMLRLLSTLTDAGVKSEGTVPTAHPADTAASRLKRHADRTHTPLAFSAPTQRADDTKAQGDFFCKCTYGQYTTEGQGKSKSEAKQSAAHKMLEILGI